jgi:hypothetical protein
MFNGPAGEAEQEGYKQFAAVEAQAQATYSGATLGGTEGGEALEAEPQTQLLRSVLCWYPILQQLCLWSMHYHSRHDASAQSNLSAV